MTNHFQDEDWNQTTTRAATRLHHTLSNQEKTELLDQLTDSQIAELYSQVVALRKQQRDARQARSGSR